MQGHAFSSKGSFHRLKDDSPAINSFFLLDYAFLSSFWIIPSGIKTGLRTFFFLNFLNNSVSPFSPPSPFVLLFIKSNLWRIDSTLSMVYFLTFPFQAGDQVSSYSNDQGDQLLLLKVPEDVIPMGCQTSVPTSTLLGKPTRDSHLVWPMYGLPIREMR